MQLREHCEIRDFGKPQLLIKDNLRVGGEGKPASCAPRTSTLPTQGGQSNQNGQPGGTQGQALLPGSQTGLKRQATAPLNVHWGHKAMPSLSSTWWRKLIHHLACSTGSRVGPCSWSQGGRWQGLALHMRRRQVSRKHQGRVEERQLLPPQTAAPQDNVTSPESIRDCPWKSDSAKL